jgi:hypothetical protein
MVFGQVTWAAPKPENKAIHGRIAQQKSIMI